MCTSSYGVDAKSRSPRSSSCAERCSGESRSRATGHTLDLLDTGSIGAFTEDMRNDWSGQRLPHPPGRLPIVGDIRGLDPRRAFQTFVEDARPLGPLSARKIFGQQFVFATTAELCAEMSDERRFEKGFTPAVIALRDYGGDGLFTAYRHEPNWQLAHDLLVPAFAKTSMERYHEVFLQVTRELLDWWGSAEGPVDVGRGMTKLTMESITRAAFSRDFGSFESEETHPFVLA